MLRAGRALLLSPLQGAGVEVEALWYVVTSPHPQVRLF